MIGKLLGLLNDREPAATGLVVQAALGLAVVYGLELRAGAEAAIVTLVVAVVTWWTRRRVTPEVRAIHRETVAAGEAALRTAIDLSNQTAGAAGDVTEKALDVVSEVIDEVTGTEEDEQ